MKFEFVCHAVALPVFTSLLKASTMLVNWLKHNTALVLWSWAKFDNEKR
jgi:hypothetical protein